MHLCLVQGQGLRACCFCALRVAASKCDLLAENTPEECVTCAQRSYGVVAPRQSFLPFTAIFSSRPLPSSNLTAEQLDVRPYLDAAAAARLLIWY